MADLQDRSGLGPRRVDRPEKTCASSHGYEEITFHRIDPVTAASAPVRVHGVLPDRIAEAIIEAVSERHFEECWEAEYKRLSRYVTNNCFTLSEKLAARLQKKLGWAEVGVLGSSELRAKDPAIEYPWSWLSPLYYVNHFVSYLRVDDLHVAVDMTAIDYLVQSDTANVANADVIAASSERELEHKLKCYYGGARWDLERL